MSALESTRRNRTTHGVKAALAASALLLASGVAFAGAATSTGGEQDTTSTLTQYTDSLAGADVIGSHEMQDVRGMRGGAAGRAGRVFLRTLEYIDSDFDTSPGGNGGLDYSNTRNANPDNLKPGTCNTAGVCAGSDRNFLGEVIEYRIEQCTGLSEPDYCETQFGF